MTSQQAPHRDIRVGVTVPPHAPASMDASTAELIDELMASVQQAVIEAGGTPVPLALDAGAAAVSERVDALVLVGGGDVHPRSYGQVPNSANYAMNERQDEFETTILRRALDEEIPVLAICRGMQLLNVTLGGTLIQDLPDPNLQHGGGASGELMVQHDVSIEDGSLLARVLERDRIPGSSGHHQAIDQLGRGLEAVATGPDGVIEAVELPTGWVMGVQWHPEHELSDPDDRARLFGGLIAAAADKST